VEGNVQVRAVAVEDGADGCAVGLVRKPRRDRVGRAGAVGAGRGAALGRAELVAGTEGAVALAEGGGGPDGEALGVAVPACVLDGGISDWGKKVVSDDEEGEKGPWETYGS